ncbi:MAG: 3-hydroxyacyl-CoA dehydrogenase/enoyl-CoA hydratase family protein [Bacteroidota bacterium]|nr:3-hydroxyacyl-CoA dehydrogenase/enoyl-CoA hydratase family protein [Bacteroidota bacterium]
MNSRRIKQVAVLGSGLMGSGIACHLAGAGFSVLLLDLAAKDNLDKNAHVNLALQKALATRPSNIFHKSFISRIRTGNFEDDLIKVSSCDWIIEVVIERLDIKQKLYEQIEPLRKPGSLITSNTSGIPMHFLIEGRSEDFKRNFCGTHFFNPPRYLKLLEIIPTQKTDPEVVSFLMEFGKKYLGKQTVLCKDTPAFIANRVGVVSMAKIFQLTEELGLSISDVDKLTGPALGRPKSGTYRLTDLVGLDTAYYVIQDLKKNCPHDSMLQDLRLPEFLQFLIDNKWYGNKSGKGFYVKTDEKDENGKNIIHALNLKTKEYSLDSKQSLESLRISKQIDEIPRRLRAIIQCKDAGAELIKKSLGYLFAYSAERIPEISDHIYSLDNALRSGFGWEYGPFEYWDAIGLETGIQLINEVKADLSGWVTEMKDAGFKNFYSHDHGKLFCYNPQTKNYQIVKGHEDVIQLNLYAEAKSPVFSNDEVQLHDIGDGVLCLEFKSKYNAIGEGILRGLQESIQLAEDQGWKGIVIGNNATNFAVGANLMLIGMLAFQQEYEQLDMAVRLFQQTSMRLRYSGIPVVCATQGYVFGGGVEFLMHCDASICAVESYIGLVEAGIGVIPGGGGTKEFALRLSDEMKEGEVIIPQLIEKFKTIATASVSTSAYEAFDLGYLLKHRDEVSINGNTHIHRAKLKLLELSDHYVTPVLRQDITVLGRSGLATLYAAAHTLYTGGYASEHDIKIAKKMAYVLCGGDLSGVQKVSETYLLDLEREAFLSLCTEPKTLERIQYMLENNKPLRN